jgi:hypothetical protein
LASDPIGATTFLFTAQKPGTVDVQFQATLNTRVILGLALDSRTLTTKVTMAVEDCLYKVTAMSRWQVPGPANINILAEITNAALTDDGQGGYTGTASVKWFIHAGRVGDCTSATSAQPSQATLTAVAALTNLVVDVDYESVSVSNVIDCGGVGGNAPWPQRPGPLTFNVPIGGGSDRIPHVLAAPDGPQPGSAVVIVTRVSGR